LVGKPAIHFISTDLKGALNVKCFWGNETLLCSIGQGTTNPHENNSSLVTLNYSGPKMVMIQTVTSFPTEGTIDCEFNYDEKTGLLLSYSTKETAKHSEGSCCWVKTDNIEQYDVYFVSLWAQQENSNIEVDVAEEYSIDNMQIIMIAIGISAIIIIGYFLLYRRRNDSNNI
jgi:LPXTG-motif cell wall-anchored protein